ncbi:MAG: hypothetical protein AMXMBFR64_23470 [Myxococcales bacterium]
MPQVLLLESDLAACRAVAAILVDAGWKVTRAASHGHALELAQKAPFDLVVTDDLDLVRAARGLGSAPVALAHRDEESEAVAAIDAGAVGCVPCPVDATELLSLVRAVEESRALDLEFNRALGQIPEAGACLTGRSHAIQQLRERVRTIAASDAPVLITGESGTGKELVARGLHDQSARRKGPFVAVNCAAFPETLLEAELFGHERGAFTGAVGRRAGRFKAADGGTLFLDEIAEIPLTAQVKLLRVLQDHVVEPLGSDASVHVDVRIVSATHRDLKERIAAGSFRADLYYRLNVLDVCIPPLRERMDDLPLLIASLVRRFLRPGQTSLHITHRAWSALRAYRFPGNVRELEHALQHAVVLSGGRVLDLHHLPSDMVAQGEGVPADALRPLADFLREQERAYLGRVLRHVDGHRTRAAEILGISRKNLWEKLRQYRMDGRDGDVTTG